ncbi:hypothetical protein GM658_03920 [Pseudoduganella eburnea]|uniref:Uncharacterized protein n=1 Tax=Massilia eburnea TaxID=1776165 RepID=A0A6L6QC02_9BURK|nr:hypothetical protein [Massilia eburnea]MTW09740.1 hypothetical protein [Massilia eburnea]
MGYNLSLDSRFPATSNKERHHEEQGISGIRGVHPAVLEAAGKKHVSGCAAGAECTFFMTSEGKFDLIGDSKK